MTLISDALLSNDLTVQATWRQFDAARMVGRQSQPWLSDSSRQSPMDFAGARWECEWTALPAADRPGAFDCHARFTVQSGQAAQVSVSIEIEVEGWSKAHYVLVPAAVYAGNRFAVRKMKYPPTYHDPADRGLNPPMLITDVPHLNVQSAGESEIQLNTGDMSTPAIGFHSPAKALGFLLLTDQESAFGNHGLKIKESDDRSRTTITLEAPCMRSSGMYAMMTSDSPSIDKAPNWKAGDSINLHFRLYLFQARELQTLFDRFALVRKDLSGPTVLRQQIPFSEAWRIQEAKQNRDNWRDGYYSVGTDGSKYGDWQLGWVGGGMTTLPLLLAGDSTSQDRARQNLDWLFERTQTESGLMVGVIHNNEQFGDCFGAVGTDHWVMTRKVGDGLYFLLKHFILLSRRDPKWKIPELWKTGTRNLADRLVAIWDQYRQFGQLLDFQTGELVQGGSTAGAIVPAGLALAGQFFGDRRYLEVAEESADFYFRRDVRHGLTTGGPGEILNCPDSESSFAMLESLVVLFEVTENRSWLKRAGEMARQFCTWVHSYDYRFPPQSPFGKLGMQSTGSVWANVQNKHSAPGICTLSGDALFKLWRATQDKWYLELLRDIVHGTPQYLSRADRPIQDLADGWMCERVNTCDWEHGWIPPGSVFNGSCWCETSNMLSYVELPGLYVNVDLSLAIAFDHIDVEVIESGKGKMRLMLTNPTAYPARVRVLVENRPNLARPLGQMALWNLKTVDLPAGGSLEYQPVATG